MEHHDGTLTFDPEQVDAETALTIICNHDFHTPVDVRWFPNLTTIPVENLSSVRTDTPNANNKTCHTQGVHYTCNEQTEQFMSDFVLMVTNTATYSHEALIRFGQQYSRVTKYSHLFPSAVWRTSNVGLLSALVDHVISSSSRYDPFSDFSQDVAFALCLKPELSPVDTARLFVHACELHEQTNSSDIHGSVDNLMLHLATSPNGNVQWREHCITNSKFTDVEVAYDFIEKLYNEGERHLIEKMWKKYSAKMENAAMKMHIAPLLKYREFTTEETWFVIQHAEWHNAQNKMFSYLAANLYGFDESIWEHMLFHKDRAVRDTCMEYGTLLPDHLRSLCDVMS